MDTVCTRDNRKAYKKKVDFVNPKDIDSELTVKQYLTFYTMVSGSYHDGTTEELIKVFTELHKEQIINKKVNELSQKDRIIVRCIAAYLRNIKLLLSKNLLAYRTEEEKGEILEFLQKYFVKKSCYCILFEDNKECTSDIIDDVRQI